MFSQTVDYALRAAAYLGIQSPVPATTKEIAETTRVPPAYLSKVLQALRRADVVHSRRGAGGGISLVKGPADLTILEVVNAVEPAWRSKGCPLGLASHKTELCPMHKRLDKAFTLVEDVLGNSTLADILAEPTHSFPLHDFPPPAAASRSKASGRTKKPGRSKQPS